jgi:hypothetical protein
MPKRPEDNLEIVSFLVQTAQNKQSKENAQKALEDFKTLATQVERLAEFQTQIDTLQSILNDKHV